MGEPIVEIGPKRRRQKRQAFHTQGRERRDGRFRHGKKSGGGQQHGQNHELYQQHGRFSGAGRP